MKKYNILILSNKNTEGFIEETYIVDSFKNDGHSVSLLWVDYDERLDDKFDVIIRRNTWVENDKEIEKYNINSKLLIKRLAKKEYKNSKINWIRW